MKATLNRIFSNLGFGAKEKSYIFQSIPGIKYIEFDTSSKLENISVQERNLNSDEKFIKVWKNSIVSGNFIFEIGSGETSIGNITFIGGVKFISI